MKKFGCRMGKRALSLICAAIVSVAIMPSSAYAAITAKTTDYLNLRSGAGTSYSVITTLPTGTQLTVLDSSNAGWAKVRTSNGKEGFCSKDYLVMGAGTSKNTGAPSTLKAGAATVTSAVNVRKSIGTSYPVLATLGTGASVTVLDISHATWAKVRTSSGIEGYCLKECLQNAGSSATTPPLQNNSGSSTASAKTTANLNIRKGIGTSYGIVTTVASGSTVTLLDTSHPTWARIRTASGLEGYCVKEYLSISSGNSQNNGGSSTPVTGISAQVTDFLNLRKGAGPSYSIMQVMSPGTQLTIIDNSNATWAKVRLSDGTIGCCVKEYLKINASTPPADNTGESKPDTPDSGGNDTNTGHTIVGATVTADALRVRSGPGTSYSIVSTVMKGASLTVLDTSNSAWTKVQTPGNLTGYVSTEYIQFRYSDEQGSSASGITLSNTTGTVSAGKTYYIKATVNPSDAVLTWSSSNSSVATVSNGYVYAVAPGTVTIKASSGSKSASASITVTAAEPVKTAYASPNIAGTGETVTLVAVTDTARDGVKFVVDYNNGTTQSVTASSSSSESVLNTSTKVWKATVNFSAVGTYRVTALSSQNGSYSSTGASTSAYVVSSQDFTAATNEQRRASDKMINLIANWEGYRSTVYADQLTSTGVPTVGYGYTFKPGTAFYNNMTKTEAWSLLVNTINNASYTSEVNRFIQNNQLLMNQNHFDALISFGYNVGAGYWNQTSSEIDLRRIMLNAVDPSGISGEMSATVSKATVVRDSPSISAASVMDISKGTAVTVTGTSFASQKDGWYAVRLSDGRTGWINSGYVTLSNAASLSHNLNYTNAYAFGTDMLRWNIAGGKSYAGLLYRRLGEANVYNYNDYSALRTNRYGYTYPEALANLDTN